jgi:hypothetical protein
MPKRLQPHLPHLPNQILFLVGCLSISLFLADVAIFGASLLPMLITAASIFVVVWMAEPVLPGGEGYPEHATEIR